MPTGKKSRTPDPPVTPEPSIVSPARQPDRLVAFIFLLEQDGVDVQRYVDRATEINLNTEVPAIPALREGEDPEPSREYAERLHIWALAVSGSTARVRAAVSQLGLSDGETPGAMTPEIQPDRISGLVEEVADRMAREVAEEEKPS